MHIGRQMRGRAQRVVSASGEREQNKGDGGESESAHDSSYRAAAAGAPTGRGVKSGLPVIQVELASAHWNRHPVLRR